MCWPARCEQRSFGLFDGPGGYVFGGFEAVVLGHFAAVGVLVVEPWVDDAKDNAFADVGDGDHDVAVIRDEGFGGAADGDCAGVLHVGGPTRAEDAGSGGK